MDKIIIFLIAWYLLYSIGKYFEARKPENIIEKEEKVARFIRENLMRNPLGLNNERELYVLRVMEDKYIHLKEKFKHDPKMGIRIAKDWTDYVSAISEIFTASEMLDVDSGEGVFERHDERVREPHIRREEIEKRYNELLGLNQKEEEAKQQKEFDEIRKRADENLKNLFKKDSKR